MIDFNTMDLTRCIALYKTEMGDRVEAIPIQDLIDFIAARVRETVGNGFAPPRYIADGSMKNTVQAYRLLVEHDSNGILFTANADILGADGNDVSFQTIGNAGDKELSCALDESDKLCLIIRLATTAGVITTDFATLYAFLAADGLALSLFSFTDQIDVGTALVGEESRFLTNGLTAPTGYAGEIVMGDDYAYIMVEAMKGVATTWRKFAISALS
jgi:hypothetical protein